MSELSEILLLSVEERNERGFLLRFSIDGESCECRVDFDAASGTASPVIVRLRFDANTTCAWQLIRAAKRMPDVSRSVLQVARAVVRGDALTLPMPLLAAERRIA